MADFVLDANVALATVLPSDASGYSDLVLLRFDSGQSALVPALWHWETMNGLLSRERRKTITTEERDEALRVVRSYPVETDGLTSDVHVIDAVAALAVRYQLTAYDASYLELAARTRLPIATQDGAIIQAARHLGVQLVQ